MKKLQMGKFLLTQTKKEDICKTKVESENGEIVWVIRHKSEKKSNYVSWNEGICKAIGLNNPIEKDIDDEKKYGQSLKKWGKKRWRKR